MKVQIVVEKPIDVTSFAFSSLPLPVSVRDWLISLVVSSLEPYKTAAAVQSFLRMIDPRVVVLLSAL